MNASTEIGKQTVTAAPKDYHLVNPVLKEQRRAKVLRNFKNPNAVIVFNNYESMFTKEDIHKAQNEFIINGQRYQKLGAILHHQGHFTAMYQRNGNWMSYDIYCGSH